MINKLAYLVSGFIFILMSSITCLVIVLRSLFGVNIMGYYELVGILSGLGVLISFIVAEEKSAHISIDILKYSRHKLIKYFNNVIVVAIYATFALGQFYAVYTTMCIGNKTAILELPLWVLYFVSGICFSVICIVSIKKYFLND